MNPPLIWTLLLGILLLGGPHLARAQTDDLPPWKARSRCPRTTAASRSRRAWSRSPRGSGARPRKPPRPGPPSRPTVLGRRSAGSPPPAAASTRARRGLPPTAQRRRSARPPVPRPSSCRASTSPTARTWSGRQASGPRSSPAGNGLRPVGSAGPTAGPSGEAAGSGSPPGAVPCSPPNSRTPFLLTTVAIGLRPLVTRLPAASRRDPLPLRGESRGPACRSWAITTAPYGVDPDDPRPRLRPAGSDGTGRLDPYARGRGCRRSRWPSRRRI